MPFGMQPTHVALVLIVALLVFGPSRLSEIGRSLGSMLREFETATKTAAQGLQEEITAPPLKKGDLATVPCKNCGKAIQPGAKFCPECGTAQIDPTPSRPDSV